MSLSLVPFLFIVTACIPNVAAAGPLNVNPVNTVTFSLYIALIAYTLFQAFRAFGILQRPQPRSGPNEIPIPPHRVPYAKIFLSTLTLLACYVLQVVWIPLNLSSDSGGVTSYNVYFGMMAADQLSDIFIASALLHFIDHRRDVYANLYHVYIAFYIVITLNITLSAFFLWRGLPKEVASAEYITRVILKHIAPLLIVRVLFKFCVDIITSVPSSFEINLDALGLVEAIVECITYAAVLYMSLSLARPVAPNPIGLKEEY